MKTNILITWLPKSWKSTLMNKIIWNYNNKIWFITKEILGSWTNRVWFEMITHNWFSSFLSHINFENEYKVWKYWVNVNNLDNIISKINNYDNELLYIDEIGEMELFSTSFKNIVFEYLNSKNIFIWSISKIYSDEFIKKIKSRNDIYLFELNELNRNQIEYEILILIKKIVR